MATGKVRITVVLIVVVHVVLLLAYTLPPALVPERLQLLSMRYVRPLFHQQWTLFAPDPPTCYCSVQVAPADGRWRPLVPPDAHYLKRRMARPLADHVQERMLAGDSILMPVLAQALRNMARDIGREDGAMHFRLLERCIAHPDHPDQRTERVTPLRLPEP